MKNKKVYEKSSRQLLVPPNLVKITHSQILYHSLKINYRDGEI